MDNNLVRQALDLANQTATPFQLIYQATARRQEPDPADAVVL